MLRAAGGGGGGGGTAACGGAGLRAVRYASGTLPVHAVSR